MANPTYYVHNLKNDLTTNQLFTSNSVELQLLPYLKFRQNVGFNYSLNEQEDMHIANSVKLADYGITAGAASRYVVKFEVNVTADWTSDPLRIWWKSKTGTFNYNFPWGGGNFNGAAYKTTGWKTVTIPLADFIYSEDDAGAKKGQKVTTLDAESVGQALETRLFIQGPDAKKLNVYWDNFRIVPKY